MKTANPLDNNNVEKRIRAFDTLLLLFFLVSLTLVIPVNILCSVQFNWHA